jgi:hypothetical protein
MAGAAIARQWLANSNSRDWRVTLANNLRFAGNALEGCVWLATEPAVRLSFINQLEDIGTQQIKVLESLQREGPLDRDSRYALGEAQIRIQNYAAEKASLKSGAIKSAAL